MINIKIQFMKLRILTASILIASFSFSSCQTKEEITVNKETLLANLKELSSDALSEIQLAITNFNFVEINYQKANDPHTSFRKIEPCAMYSTQNKWILIAWCHLRTELRAFRIDRIKHFKILHETFEDRKFSIQDYFASFR